MKDQQLNYSSLAKIAPLRTRYNIVTALVLLIISIPLFVLALYYVELFMTIVFLPFIVVITVSIRYYLYNKDKQKVLSQFAQDNDFKYEPNVKQFDKKTGVAFNIGRQIGIRNLISGQFDKHPFSDGAYVYETGSGKNRSTHRVQYTEINLGRILPQFLINSKLSSAVSGYSFDRSQLISLEGDFSKYFDLYVPKDHQITALSILTPDVMDFLITKATICDIEIVDDKLYFYWHSYPNSEEAYEERFNVVRQMLVETGRKLTTGNILNESLKNSIEASAQQSGSAPVKLKKTTTLVSLAAVIMFLLVGSQIFYASGSTNLLPFDISALIFLLVFAGIFGYAVTYSIKQRWLKKSLENRKNSSSK